MSEAQRNEGPLDRRVRRRGNYGERKMAKELPKDCPKKGERWDNLHGGGTCRVMCDPVEGYVIARYKGAGPWLLHVNDWHKKFRRQGEKPSNYRYPKF